MTPDKSLSAVPYYYSSLACGLTPYVPGEQPKDRKFIKLNTNENPYPPSPAVIEAIRNAANENLRLYPDPSCSVLREAAAARWGIKAEQVFGGNGSDEILAFAFAAFFNSAYSERPGQQAVSARSVEPILFPNISYSFYPVYAALWNIPFKTPELDREFNINPQDYKQNCGGVILANPNAPTGKALGIKALKEIAEAQLRNKKVFIVDEAYIEFADSADSGSMIPFINEYPNMLIIHTLSKDASLAGMRAAYAVGSEELIGGLCRIRDSFNSYTMDRLAQAASAAAITDTAYYSEVNAKVCRTRERTSAALADLGFKVIPSQANFIFASPPSDAIKFFAALREKGFLVRHFNRPLTKDWLRISMGTDAEMDALVQACRQIISENNRK
ncbi:MAG: aminotransferase class I/II-fold pyridoxal phosphate-dependent enzyme [Treponema sp.]|nr:aminotransferase class I/II-fold pyridoxal phosphate-dependent enzyme [Treponema sp.]